MKLFKKQLIAARNDLLKYERRLDRCTNSLAKKQGIAEKLSVAIPINEWQKIRNTATEEQHVAHFDYYSASEDVKDAIRSYQIAEKYLMKLEEKQAKEEGKIEAENKLLRQYQIPAIEKFLDEWEKWTINYYKTKGEYDEKKQKDIKWEKSRKKLYIIYKVEQVVGKITDASALTVGIDGNINGVVKGERGNCYCQSIMAGGYNIQCLHFRFLVDKLR